MIEAVLSASTNKDKKYKVVVSDGTREKTIHFGAKGYQDFTIHGDDRRKAAYLERHRSAENWSDPFTAGFWAVHALWNKRTLVGSLADIRKRYNIKIQSLI